MPVCPEIFKFAVMRETKSLIAALLLVAMSLIPAMAQEPGREVAFFDTGAPSKFLEPYVNIMVGASGVSQNFGSRFSSISELNVSAGVTGAMGGGVVFGIRDFLGLGTEMNFAFNNWRMDMMVSGDATTSPATIFLRNHYYTLNVPVYVSVRFNPARKLRWNVDGGLYFSFGLGGSQKQSITKSYINALGQLVTEDIDTKSGYFQDSDAFICSSKRTDIGLHLGTSLTFSGRFSVGVRTHIGFKNMAEMSASGIVRPSIHNVNVWGVAAWHF